MNLQHRQQIGRAFSQARDYDRHAQVQRRVARALAGQIAGLDLPASPRILEIGCGTGFLTEALAERGIGGDWLVTDLAPAMVERCRRRIGAQPGWRFAVLDGEYGEPEAGERFDLICSSLAMQWFDDLEAATARMLGWLAPGGQLVFTTLAAGTFAEWRAAHAAEGLSPGTPDLPTAAQLAAIQQSLQCGPPRVDRHAETYCDARTFLRALKAIGASTASSGHRPLPPEAMRRVMRSFEKAGASVTFEVVTCHYRIGGAA